MFGSPARNAAAIYSNIGVQTDVSEASPHKLILMLFDGALLASSKAIAAIEEKDIEAKIKHITHAIEIISRGLQASLDPTVGGELSGRLNALYEYMCARLAFANLKNSTATILEVISLLKDLREAWSAIEGSASQQAETTFNYEEA